MMNRRIVSLALCAALAPLARAQTHAVTLDLLRRGAMASATASAQAAVAKTATAADYQVEGVVLAANGRMAEALNAFQQGLKIAKRQETPSGLESLSLDSPLLVQLRSVKGIFAFSCGEAAFRNNVGLAQLMLGKMKAGFDQLTLVHQISPNFGAAYVNEGVGHLLKSEGSKTVNSAKRAVDLGETSPIARSVLAEGYVIVNRFSDAADQLKIADQDQPDHPIVLEALSKLAAVQGDTRAAEKYHVQALAAGGTAVVDGALAPSHTVVQQSGGTSQDQHSLVDQRSYIQSQTGVAVVASDDKDEVQGRQDASQTLGNTTAEVANKTGALHLDYIDLAGGRPGTDTFEPGVTQDPTANLNFRQANSYGDFNVGPFLFHVGYRTSNSNLSDAGSAMLGHDDDSQLSGEVRLMLPKWGGQNISGFAYTRLNRNLTNDVVIDPTEELLPNGRTDLWTFYAIHRRTLNPKMKLDFGGNVGRNGVAVVGAPYFDLAVALTPKEVLHAGYSTRFNTDVSDLMPNELTAPSPLDNTIDRNDQGTTPYNLDPVLIPQQGRQQTYGINLRSDLNPRLTLNTALFHHELKDVVIQGTDPQTATFINPNAVSSGQATGVSETVGWDAWKNASFRIQGRFQRTNMTSLAQLYNGSNPGQPSSTDLPFFANLGLDVGFNLGGGDWSSTLVASTLGQRTVTTAVPMGNGTFCCSYLQIVNPVTSWNLFVHKQFGEAKLYISLYNITRVSFFPGERGRMTVVIGFQL